ncbi:MAG: nucleotidyltransferase family protein [Alkaliphilus sp.]
MSIIEIVHKNKNDIVGIASKHGVVKVRLFGSVARKEDNFNSDIDFLVKFEEGRSLFDLILLKEELENLLKRKVDVVTEDSIHWMIRDQIKSEVVEI